MSKSNETQEKNSSFLKPYFLAVKTWLINMSVASLAVGLFQNNPAEVYVGIGLAFLTLVVIYFEERGAK